MVLTELSPPFPVARERRENGNGFSAFCCLSCLPGFLSGLPCHQGNGITIIVNKVQWSKKRHVKLAVFKKVSQPMKGLAGLVTVGGGFYTYAAFVQASP